MGLKAVAHQTGGGGGGGGVAISAGTTLATSGTVYFSNSPSVTFGMDGAGNITASVSPAGAGLTNINVSAGTTSQNLSALTFSNGSGVSFGLNGSVITGAVATAYAGLGFTSASTAGSDLAATLSTNGLSVGVPKWLTTARASTDGVGLATAQTNVTWTVNSAGISLNAGGYAGTGFTSTTTAGTAVVATHNTAGLSMGVPAYLTTAALSADSSKYAGTNGAITGGSITVNTSGVSINLPAYITTARASTDGVGLNTAQTNVTWTVNSSGISLNAGGYAGTGFTSTTTAGTAIVGTHNTAGLSLGVPAYLTTARASTDAVGLATAQTNVTWTVNSAGISLNASGYAGTNSAITGGSMTVNSSGISISLPAQAPSPIVISAGTSSGSFSSVVFSNSNGVSFGLNGSTITASAAGGAGGGIALSNSQTLFTSGTVALSGQGALTIASSAGGQSFMFSVPQTSSLVGVSGIGVSSNGSTISIYEQSVNAFEPMPLLQSGSTTYAPGAGSWHLQPFSPPNPLLGGRLNIMVAHGSTASNFRATTANYASGTTGTLSITGWYERRLALYSIGAGTNSTRLESFWSNNFPLSFTHVVQIASGGATNMTVSQSIAFSMITSIGSDGGSTLSGTTFNGNTSIGNSSMQSNSLTSVATAANNFVSSQLMLPIPFNTTLPGGEWYIGMMWNSSSGSAATGAAIASSAVNTLSVVNQYALRGEDANTGARAWLQSAASSGSIFFPGHGVYSATSASAPATIGFSDIRTLALMPLNYVNWVNSTI